MDEDTDDDRYCSPGGQGRRRRGGREGEGGDAVRER